MVLMPLLSRLLTLLVILTMPLFFFFFQAEDGIRVLTVTGVQTCALPISRRLSAHRRLGAGAQIVALREATRKDHHVGAARSEERRVGKECRARWWRCY